MAEAMFGINQELIKKAKDKIPKEFKQIIKKAYARVQDDEEFER